MLDEHDFKVVEAMDEYGGSFVKALAQCFRCADPHNFYLLKSTFKKYWDEYEEMANNP